MVLVPRIWHPLDDVQAMLGDIHFDPTAYAHAPRPFWCVVDTGKRILQLGITRQVRPTLDQVPLLFHAVSRKRVWVRLFRFAAICGRADTRLCRRGLDRPAPTFPHSTAIEHS